MLINYLQEYQTAETKNKNYVHAIFEKTELMKKKQIINRQSNLNAENNSNYFTGKENHQISLEEASELTRSFRENHPNETIAEFFGKETVLAILNQPNCVGIRIYYGQEPGNGQKHLVLVGADSNQNDLYLGLIAERAMSCPKFCSNSNALNT